MAAPGKPHTAFRELQTQRRSEVGEQQPGADRTVVEQNPDILGLHLLLFSLYLVAAQRLFPLRWEGGDAGA